MRLLVALLRNSRLLPKSWVIPLAALGILLVAAPNVRAGSPMRASLLTKKALFAEIDTLIGSGRLNEEGFIADTLAHPMDELGQSTVESHGLASVKLRFLSRPQTDDVTLAYLQDRHELKASAFFMVMDVVTVAQLTRRMCVSPAEAKTEGEAISRKYTGINEDQTKMVAGRFLFWRFNADASCAESVMIGTLDALKVAPLSVRAG
jgi:hypothetical protein